MASTSTQGPELPVPAPILQNSLVPIPEEKAMRKIALAAMLLGGGGIVNFPVEQLPAGTEALQWLSKGYPAACFACYASGLILLSVSLVNPESLGGARWVPIFKNLKWFVLALVVLVITMRAALHVLAV